MTIVEHASTWASLARREALYDKVVESLGEGLVIQDATGRTLTCNPAAERILGLDRGALIGDSADNPVWRAVDENGARLAGASFPGPVALRTGLPVVGFAMGFERSDGDFRWLEVDAYPMFGTVGELEGVVVSIRDVTQTRAAREQALFQARLLEAVGQAVIATDPAGTITYWNGAAEQLYGWSPVEALGRSLADFITLPGTAEEGARIFAGLVEGRSWSGDFEVCRRDGTVFHAMVTDTPVFGEDGRLAAIIGVSSDITERKRSEDAIRQLSAIVESSGDAIIGTSLDGTILSWNRGAEQLYGYLAAEAIGANALMLLPDSESTDRLTHALTSVARGETIERLEGKHLRKSGELVEVWLTISPVLGADGTVVGLSSITRDVTARVRAERALAHQSLHDTLTGLPNRALLQDRLQQDLARARSHHDLVAVLCLGLDGFKLVNEGFGHGTGDRLLVEVAERLRAAVSAQDTVARVGGDQFVVACEVDSLEAAVRVGRRLLAAVEAPFVLEGRDVIVTASVGLVLANLTASPESLLHDGDVAMYRAKERGRSRVELYDEGAHQNAAIRLHTTTELRGALDRDELRVYFQPVVGISDTRPLGVEALLRWEHPERGLVAPGEFIPLAEETGLIVPIGRWVLREALLQRARWQEAFPGHRPLRLAVNLSARQLSDPTLVADVRSALEATGAEPGSLVLEITESVLAVDPYSVATLDALRDMGVSLHIDDFGTGYSSLAYLKQMPVDALKVDRSFVDGLGASSEDLSIVTTIIALARTLSLSVIAEGVETENQLRVLRELGCDFAQGFFFARPMPYDKLVDWLAGRLA